jgi:4'-phosphopantetheinyl transferase
VNNPSATDKSSLSAGELSVPQASADVWVLPIRASRQLVDELQQTLSSDEIARVLRFRAEEGRDLFIVGRGILRKILSRYASKPAEKLVFRYGSKGKPYLLDHSDPQFNLGHSGGLAVYAISGKELGVDIETVKPSADWRKISERFFSPREVEELERLYPTQQLRGFFSCWARKEAYIKAIGEGIATLAKFYAGAQPPPGEGPIDEEGKPREWYFKDLKVGDEHACAIVTQFDQCRIRLFEFSSTEECFRFTEKENH